MTLATFANLSPPWSSLQRAVLCLLAWQFPLFPPKKNEASLLADLERHHAWALAHVETLRERAGDLFRTRLRKRLSSDENIMRMWHEKYEETARTYPACARILDHSAHVTHHLLFGGAAPVGLFVPEEKRHEMGR